MVEAARSIPGCYGARLTGAGFGGCTIQLVQREKAGEFTELLKEKYFRATGIQPEIFSGRPANGAGII
jgi:galactokinase